MSQARRWDFFETEDGTMEPWLINGLQRRNPPLVIVNRPTKKKGKKTMAVIRMRRNKKGQYVARARTNRPAARKSNKPRHHHRKTRRKNFMGAGAVVPFVNRPRRRKNPPDMNIAGFPLAIPEVGTIAAVIGGLIGPTTIQTIGASLASSNGTQQISPTTKTVIKAVSYVAPPIIGYMLGGVRTMRTVIAAEIATALAGQVASMVQSALGSAGLSSYTRAPRRTLGTYTGPVSRAQLSSWQNRRPANGNASATRFTSRFHD